MTTVNKSDKDRVVIFDTTLRDGEQCPGAHELPRRSSRSRDARRHGRRRLEAGFPITSEATSRRSARSPAFQEPVMPACRARIRRTSTAARKP